MFKKTPCSMILFSEMSKACLGVRTCEIKLFFFLKEGNDKHKTPSGTFPWGVKQMNGIKEARKVKGNYW